MSEDEAEKMAARADRNAKRRARRATLRALYEANAPGTSKYGSAMGRPSWGLLTFVVHRGAWERCPDAGLSWPDGSSVVVQRVRGCDGGDYDRLGTYWGNLRGSPLYWVAVVHGDELRSEAFIRAKDAAEVRSKLRTYFEGIRFRSA